MPRARTVSMNHSMGAPWNHPDTTSYRKMKEITRPSPSEAFVIVEERTDTINDRAFTVLHDDCGRGCCGHDSFLKRG
jgi:hypothetical protein